MKARLWEQETQQIMKHDKMEWKAICPG